MRISCNGCRVLRKGCSNTCSIRPCLDWIKSPESQANATMFLAKFYGRAGLINLVNAGPHHLRPAIFNSLLYEACGRIVNPIHGSAGLLSSGNWKLWQRAVEAVLQGTPIIPLAVDAAETKTGPPMKAAYDIRHINKEGSLSAPNDPHGVKKRCRFKRPGVRVHRSRVWFGSVEESGREEINGSPSHESSLSHQSSFSLGPEPEQALDSAGENGWRRSGYGSVDLDLTLGFKPFKRCNTPPDSLAKGAVGPELDGGAEICKNSVGI